MGVFTRIVDPYNTMGAAQQQRTERSSARKASRSEKGRVEAVARKWGLTLEAAAEFTPAIDDAETYGVHTRRGSRASDFCQDILDDPKNRKDWYRR